LSKVLVVLTCAMLHMLNKLEKEKPF